MLALTNDYRALGAAVADLLADAAPVSGTRGALDALAGGALPSCWNLLVDVGFVRHASGLHLEGVSELMLDTAGASLLVVNPHDGAKQTWCAIDPAASGGRVEAVTPVDTTRSVGRVHLADVAVPPGAQVETTQARVCALAVVALAAEASGRARWCLDTAVAYVELRGPGQPPCRVMTRFLTNRLQRMRCWATSRCPRSSSAGARERSSSTSSPSGCSACPGPRPSPSTSDRELHTCGWD